MNLPSQNSSIILQSKYQYTYGPYKPLTTGNYRITITRQNLDKIVPPIIKEYDNIELTVYLISATSTEAIYGITTPQDYIS